MLIRVGLRPMVELAIPDANTDFTPISRLLDPRLGQPTVKFLPQFVRCFRQMSPPEFNSYLSSTGECPCRVR